MKVYIAIEYFEEEGKNKGNSFIKYPFEYNPEEYQKELIEEIKRILNKYLGLISLNISIH